MNQLLLQIPAICCIVFMRNFGIILLILFSELIKEYSRFYNRSILIDCVKEMISRKMLKEVKLFSNYYLGLSSYKRYML